ncbi:MAG TPA: 4Fe-4S dicluster domain-containing protein [Chloroflexi bacterium]|nr:4Fe-4S dicluster domain-containing protein [Chloroflexota bacterium]
MARLSVEIAGLCFSTPVLPAAGPPVWNGEAMRACAEGGAGGIVSKTVSVRPAVVPTPNMAQIPGGFLNTELWSELPLEQFMQREYPMAKNTGLPLIISLGYTAEEIAELAPRVRPFADALELSTHYIGDDPTPMQEAIRAAKDAVDVPVFVKLSPFRDMKTAARAAAEAGADGIVAVNSFGPCLGVDVEAGRLLMGSKEGYGWLSGPALKPLALRCVFDVAQAVDLPIIGVGGISRGTDAIEFFMVGASAVGVCTAAILKGPKVFGRIARQIEKWLDEHGYGSVEEVRGLAIRRWQERAFRTAHVPPGLDVDACTGCGLCEASCVYDAIHVMDGKAVLAPDKCYGCGLCVTRCPTRALSIT